jgi:beta-mannosidase
MAMEGKTIKLNENWQFKATDENSWMMAEVPGCVHTDLIRAGIIEDPYYRLNEHNVQWIDKKDWEYKTVFSVDKSDLKYKTVELTFFGLDTYAEVRLNGKSILSSDNMFRTYTLDVKKHLIPGENHLHIVFKSPINEGLKKYDALDYKIPASGNDLAKIGKVEGEKRVSIFTRKAGYHFGWDWGPRLVTSGVWKPIELSFWNEAKIQDVFIQQTALDNENAKLTLNAEIESLKELKANYEILVEGTIVKSGEFKFSKGANVLKETFIIENPKRWWPNDMGDQYLYDIQFVLKMAKDISLEKIVQIGLRDIELVQEKDTAGVSFYFKVNNVPTFMKGANYIPQDVFLDRVTPEKYEKVIADAVNANMNMLRVWGGGIYEKDIFYELCDKHGILVWQDFMFACAMFPGDDAFLENVRQEAIDNVKRLRNHTCIALWCGNNEIADAWDHWNWSTIEEEAQGKEVADKIWKAYDDIFHKILPEVIKEYDKDRFYWPSSPGEAFGKSSALHSGDFHYWGVWWGKEPFENYGKMMPRFMSEFGFQSFPEFKAVKKYSIAEDWDIYSEVMKSHQRSSIGNKTIEEYMLRDYKKPKDFEHFLYVGQVLQAEGIQMGMEAHRRNMPYCMGSLYWQINDCWPVASWSSTDYYGNWKALHYRVRDAFETTILSLVIEDSILSVYAVNDSLQDFDAELNLQIVNFKGELEKESVKKVHIKANASMVLMNKNITELMKGFDENEHVLKAKLKDKHGNIVATKLHYLVAPKDLILTEEKPKLEVSVKNETTAIVKVTSSTLLKNVFLETGLDGFFSANYFDVLPGQEYLVTFKADNPMAKEDFIEKLKAISLVDSY